MLETVAVATVREIATAETINESYVSRVLRLTLLAQETLEAILDGRHVVDVTLPVAMKGFPVEGKGQGTTLSPVTNSHDENQCQNIQRNPDFV